MKWMPIESAPKDGTAILVLLRGSDIPLAARYYERVGWQSTWDGYNLIGMNYPVCWMPIPRVKRWIDTDKPVEAVEVGDVHG